MEGHRVCAVALAVALVFSSLIALGTAAASNACPYPLGEPAASGENAVLGGGDDPEFQIIDATRVDGGNQVQGTLLASEGRMAVVQEMKVEFGTSTNDTDMVMLRWFEDEKGWNGTPVWLSSIDSTQQVPDSPPGYVAFHSHLFSTVWRDQVWTIWEGWHSLWAPENQVMLLRGASPDWVSPMFVASDVRGDYDSAKYGAIADAGDALMVVYVVKEYPATVNEYDVVWRLFDGENFTAVKPLSAKLDGWSETRPMLVADGGRVFAVWTAYSMATNAYTIRWSVFDGAQWSAPRVALETGALSPPELWPAVYAGKLWVAFDTSDPYLVNGADYEIVLISVDPATGSVSTPLMVSPQPSAGDDTRPTLLAAAGKLWVGWVTVDPAYTHHLPINDTDAVYRTYDGQRLGPIVELSDANDSAVDGSPNFFEWEGSVYAYWSIGKFPPPEQYKHDYRQAVQLLERSNSTLEATSAVMGVEDEAEDGTARVWVDVHAPEDVPAVAPTVLAGDGTHVELEYSGERWTGVLTGEQLAAGSPQVAMCGKPLATVQDDSIVPGAGETTTTTPFGAPVVVVAIVAAAGAAALGRGTARRRR